MSLAMLPIGDVQWALPAAICVNIPPDWEAAPSYFFEFFIRIRAPIIIKIPQITKKDMDFGPLMSFTGFPIIISNVQTNAPPKTPNTINMIPFFFIFSLLLNVTSVLSTLPSCGFPAHRK